MTHKVFAFGGPELVGKQESQNSHADGRFITDDGRSSDLTAHHS